MAYGTLANVTLNFVLNMASKISVAAYRSFSVALADASWSAAAFVVGYFQLLVTKACRRTSLSMSTLLELPGFNIREFPLCTGVVFR